MGLNVQKTEHVPIIGNMGNLDCPRICTGNDSSASGLDRRKQGRGRCKPKNTSLWHIHQSQSVCMANPKVIGRSKYQCWKRHSSFWNNPSGDRPGWHPSYTTSPEITLPRLTRHVTNQWEVDYLEDEETSLHRTPWGSCTKVHAREVWMVGGSILQHQQTFDASSRTSGACRHVRQYTAGFQPCTYGITSPESASALDADVRMKLSSISLNAHIT